MSALYHNLQLNAIINNMMDHSIDSRKINKHITQDKWRTALLKESSTIQIWHFDGCNINFYCTLTIDIARGAVIANF